MTDLEITRLCAEAMGLQRVTVNMLARPGIGANPPYVSGSYTGTSMDVHYDPLHDDAQAMALVKKLGLEIHCREDRNGWYVGFVNNDSMVPHADLNRAICECVANMRLERQKEAA